MWQYIVKIGNSLSQLLNVVFLNGYPDECLSGRAYRTGTRWAIEDNGKRRRKTDFENTE